MGLVGMSPAADMRLGVVLSILSSLVSSMGIVLQRHYLRKHKPGDSSTQCLTLIGVLCVVLGMALKVMVFILLPQVVIAILSGQNFLYTAVFEMLLGTATSDSLNPLGSASLAVVAAGLVIALRSSSLLEPTYAESQWTVLLTWNSLLVFLFFLLLLPLARNFLLYLDDPGQDARLQRRYSGFFSSKQSNKPMDKGQYDQLLEHGNGSTTAEGGCVDDHSNNNYDNSNSDASVSTVLLLSLAAGICAGIFASSCLLVVMSVSYIASSDHSEGSVALQVLGLLAFLGLCAFLGLLKLRTVSAALRLVDAARFLPLYQACSVASSVLCGVVFLQERDEVAHPFFYALGTACVCLGTAARALHHPSVRAHIEASPALWRLDVADHTSFSVKRVAGALRCCCCWCCCYWPFAAEEHEWGAKEVEEDCGGEGERETHNLLGSAGRATSSRANAEKFSTSLAALLLFFIFRGSESDGDGGGEAEAEADGSRRSGTDKMQHYTDFSVYDAPGSASACLDELLDTHVGHSFHSRASYSAANSFKFCSGISGVGGVVGGGGGCLLGQVDSPMYRGALDLASVARGAQRVSERKSQSQSQNQSKSKSKSKGKSHSVTNSAHTTRDDFVDI